MAAAAPDDSANRNARDAQGVRLRARAGWTGDTAGLAPGCLQANLVVVPQAFAGDFEEFCRRNPKPCPLLERTEVGSPHLKRLAAGADLRTDLPAYRVFRDGVPEGEAADIRALWRADFVAFLLGCSFTFEEALLEAGVRLRHIEEGRNVAMYRTNVACEPAGPFAGPLVVSMRPIARARLDDVRAITARFPFAHGAPVYAGDPAALGIADLDRPDYGDGVRVADGEVPVFWACGVTPQEALRAARLPLAVTHKPGCMFVADATAADAAAWA